MLPASVCHRQFRSETRQAAVRHPDDHPVQRASLPPPARAQPPSSRTSASQPADRPPTSLQRPAAHGRPKELRSQHRQTPALAAQLTQQNGRTAPPASLALSLLTLPKRHSDVFFRGVESHCRARGQHVVTHGSMRELPYLGHAPVAAPGHHSKYSLHMPCQTRTCAKFRSDSSARDMEADGKAHA